MLNQIINLTNKLSRRKVGDEQFGRKVIVEYSVTLDTEEIIIGR